MAKKRTTNSNRPAQGKAAPAPAKGNSKLLITTAVVLVVAIGAIWFIVGSSRNAAASNIPADEARYIGRLLPSGYQEPSVAGAQSYGDTIRAAQVQPTADSAGVSIPLAQLVSNKIVQFDFKRSDGQSLPMLAYIKPSGKLFVGVNFCIPCQGVGQRIEGGVLTCNTCGTTRDLETGAGLTGACRLYPLDEVPAAVSGGKITVGASVLNAWQPQPKDRKTGA